MRHTLSGPVSQKIADQSHAEQIDLETFDISKPDYFRSGAHEEYFRRMRREAPVHYCPDSMHGPYWSVTRFNDIQTVEKNHQVFSSRGGITIGDEIPALITPMFIASDPPRHDIYRGAVTPAVAPDRLAELENVIRGRAGAILDSLPENEEFNWVERVSIDLTCQMLATLFDMPMEDRFKLPIWSEASTTSEQTGRPDFTLDQRRELLFECLDYFKALWLKRAEAPAKLDFISLFAHHPETSGMIDDEMRLLGNMMLLVVGGNDTTRHSISGGVVALNRFPAEFAKLKANPDLIPNMVSEIIRYQSPISHMRRRAVADFELGGQQIREGDKVVMWYVSGNRDESEIDQPDQFIIDRARARHHIAFGFGIHRCMGNRMAEMQLRVLWEEIMKRFDQIEMVGTPTRTLSNFVNGWENVPVKVRRK